MAKVERIHWLAITATLGWVAVVIHAGANYQWLNGHWAPSVPIAIPFAAILPPIALYIAFKELKVNAKRASPWFFMLLTVWSLAILAAFSYDVATM